MRGKTYLDDNVDKFAVESSVLIYLAIYLSFVFLYLNYAGRQEQRVNRGQSRHNQIVLLNVNYFRIFRTVAGRAAHRRGL